jgi:urea transport system permease protein
MKKSLIKITAQLLFTLVLPLMAVEGFSESLSAPLSYQEISQALPATSLRKLPALVEQIAQAGRDEAKPLLQAMLSGLLYFRKSDKQLLVVKKNGDEQYTIFDPFTQEKLGVEEKTALKKVRVNNRVRSMLRQAIAQIELNAENVDVRMQAVSNLLKKLTPDKVKLLIAAREKETDPDVLQLIDIARALGDLNKEDQPIRLRAIDQLEGNLQPIVKVRLSALVEKSSDGDFIEKDILVRERAQKALSSIESKIQFYQKVETIFFGLSLGSVLLLVATGLAITFGVMGVINMAHGELIMIGAYTTYVVQLLMPGAIEWSILVAVPAAFIVSGLVGLGIERGVIRFLQGRPLETLLATFGVSLILQQAVRTVFSPLNRQVETPAWMSGSLEINSVLSLTYNRLYILIFALLVFVLMQFIFKKTSLGLYVRAVSQNRKMAKAMGVRSEFIDAMTFSLGSGIAGVAGVALSQLTNVGPNLGQAYIIDSFMVVVFGGVGNLWGTLVGGFSLGVLNKFLEPATGTVLAKIIVLVFIILFIQKRPRGLFPQKGRAAES